MGKAKRRRLRRKKRKANPASLRSAAPSKGRGSRGYSLLPMEGGAPKGRRLDGESGIPDTKPSPRGEGCDTRMPFSPYCHFERKREIFFVRGQAKDVRIAASGKHRASSESEGRCFMQTALRKKTETGNEKDPSAALGMTKRGNASFHSFPFLFNLLRKPTPPRCARQPLPREGACVDTPSFLWKGGECRLTDFPQRRLTIRECRFPHIVISSESEKIFFVCGQAKDVRIAASGKHRASSESEGRCFMQTALRKKTETGNEKDPSAALGMTKRGNASFHSFPFLFNLLRKPTPPRCARQPLPREGLAWTLPSSYGEGYETGMDLSST